MFYKKEILSGPIEKDKKGQKTNGYLFSITEKWQAELSDMDNDVDDGSDDDGFVGGVEVLPCDVEYESWEIYTNGEFRYDVCSDGRKWCGGEEGTFDPTRYEEFVNQMKEYKTDWMNELSWDHKNSDYTWG